MAKRPHPLPKPVKDAKQSNDEYQLLLKEWLEIDQTLPRFKIKELVCESGYRIPAIHIAFYYGENRLAEVNSDGSINILPEKLLKSNKK